jgi:hypothetical protein
MYGTHDETITKQQHSKAEISYPPDGAKHQKMKTCDTGNSTKENINSNICLVHYYTISIIFLRNRARKKTVILTSRRAPG